jgi:cell division protein FtsI (penicillin-binding protein 3)
MLRDVVRSGTGKNAQIPGYVVAGKTGTAQKVDPSGHYSMIDHVASFVGFVPADRPALVVLVSLDSPRGPRNQGGDVAAPVFARVAEAALRYRAIAPDDASRVLRAKAPLEGPMVPVAYRPEPAPPREGDDEGEPALMPDLRGRSARDAAIVAARRGLIVELRGSGRVVEQSPEPGTEIEAGNPCVLTLGPEPGGAP